jgi:hypothetical protein
MISGSDWRLCVIANRRFVNSVPGVGLRRSFATLLFPVLLLFAANAFAQDDAGMAAMQASQMAMQASQQAMQDMQTAAASQMATQQAIDTQQAMQMAAMQNSFASTPRYGRADKPHFYPAARKFASATLVSIQDNVPKATIFYTLDGTAPTTSSHPYTGPILIRSTTRLKAIARSPILSPSRVARAKYVIK